MDKELILKYALQNAVKFNGKANPSAVIGKLLAEDPSIKPKIKEVYREMASIIKEVNSWPIEKQMKKIESLAPELLEKKKVERETKLPELRNTENVRMRFEPSPSGALHIGHAYVLSLNHLYCKKYNGKLIIRISDTNPENIYPGAYELIKKDAEWLTNHGVDKFYIQSERLDLYYVYMKKLLDMGKAYICTCNVEEFRKLNSKSLPCPCRELPNEEQIKRWHLMFTKYKEGEAVARLKTNLKNKNPAMREFPLFRIVEEEHPRQEKKFRVWPLMNMAVAVDDMDMEMNNIIRAKDHADNAKRQQMIFEIFEKPIPDTQFVGKTNFKDIVLSATQITQGIKEGKYSGWDDISLPSLAALRRRGYTPEAFLKYTEDVGVSLTDKTIYKEDFFKALDHFNKEVIDDKTYRYFFIWDPVEIKIENSPRQTVELDLHPDNEKGGRIFKITERFYITRADYRELKDNKLYRMMDCLNFKKKGKKFIFDSLGYNIFKERGEKIIHWLPKDENLINVMVLMPDKKTIIGKGEPLLNNLKTGTIVQFERFGFCRLDEKEKKLVFWYGHK